MERRTMTARDSASANETHDRSVKNAPNGLQVVHVDTLGRGGVVALWASAFIAAAALIAVIAMCFWIDRLSARVYVLEYDVGNMCAELKAREIVNSCH
jgi:hypothetical protein